MRNHTALLVVSCLVLGLGVPQTLGAPPNEYDVMYSIHETPTDPNSGVTLEITLSLSPHEVAGDAVGWEVDSVQIRELASGGAIAYLWSETSPSVSTADGLWWIDHEDANEPDPAEFILPPPIAGAAAADNPSDPDLDYDIEGQSYSGTQYYDVTAGLDYELTLEGEQQPLVAAVCDPVEIEPGHKD